MTPDETADLRDEIARCIANLQGVGPIAAQEALADALLDGPLAELARERDGYKAILEDVNPRLAATSERVNEALRYRDKVRKLLAEAGEMIETLSIIAGTKENARSILARIKEASNG